MAELPSFFINNYNLYFDSNDPKYFLNAQKQLLIGQFFDFQIYHLCEHLKIPYQNEFGLYIPNKILLKQIKEHNLENILLNCPTCQKIGFGVLPKIKNNFSYNNIGGKNSNQLELDISQNYLNLSTEPLYKSSENNVIIQLPIDPRFLQELPKKEKINKEKLPFLKGLIQKIQRERHLIGQENIQNGKTELQKIGKIDYSINSSYIDTILMLIFLPIENSFFENILNINPRLSKLNKPAYISQNISNKINRPELTKKILELNKTFIEYKEKILNGEILNSQKLRITFQMILNEPGLLTFPYYLSKKDFPIFNLYKDILKFNLIDNYYSTDINKYFIQKDDDTIYSGSVDIPKDAIITIEHKSIDKKTEHIGFEIKGDILKYLITRDRYRLPAESRIYCPICNEFINRFEKNHLGFHKSNKIILSNLMDFQIDIIKTESVPNHGYSYEIKADGKIYYDNKNPKKLYTEQEAISLGIANQYERAVYEYSIYNTECISFYINRFEKRINKQSHMEDVNFIHEIPVHLEEIITDKNDNHYKLTAIITQSGTNHMLFFQINNYWYVYNSMFDPDIVEDYIVKIGTLLDLSNYREGLVKKLGVVYFYQLQ